MPQQPTYGEGMADAMKAQMEMLTGKTLGEDEGFEELYASALGREGGTLADILREFEAPMRKETAQLDTDVMRQTLLGGQKQLIQDEKGDWGFRKDGAFQPADDTASGAGGNFFRQGNEIWSGESKAPLGQKDFMVDNKYMERLETNGTPLLSNGAEIWTITDAGREAGYAPHFAEHPAHGDVIYAKEGKLMPGVQAKSLLPEGANADEYFIDRGITATGGAKGLSELAGSIFEEVRSGVVNRDPDSKAPPPKLTYHDPNTGQKLKEGDVVREGTGMLDLFGPTEAGAVTKQVTTGDERFEAFVNSNQNLRDRYAAIANKGVQKDPVTGEEIPVPSVSEFGRDYYFNQGGKERVEAGEMEAVPSVGESYQVSRRAGFDPDTGEFLGLTTMGADVGEQLARRQRAADIYDVEKLGPLATRAYRQQGVEYDAAGNAIAGTGIAGTLATARGLGPGGTRPATQADVDAGRATTVGEGIAAPSAMPSFATQADVDAGRAREVGDFFTGAATADLRGMAQELGYAERAATAEDVAAGRAATAGDMIGVPSISGGRIGGDYRAFDPETGAAFDVEGKGYGADPLRMAMLQQVQEGLGEGLTERELRTLREGARSRATAMGRTYDPKATMDELKIQLMEDEGRRAQRLQQAQSVLGGEVGIQQADLGRDVQAQLANLQTQQAGIGRELGAAESDVERAMRQQAMSENYRQAGLGQERAAAAQMVGLEQATGADPFQAILGRPSGAGAQMGQQMFGQAGYGLQSQPQYLNPEAGLSYISQAAANEASMWGAGQMAQAGKQSGLMGALGSIGGSVLGGPIGGAIGKRMFS